MDNTQTETIEGNERVCHDDWYLPVYFNSYNLPIDIEIPTFSVLNNPQSRDHTINGCTTTYIFRGKFERCGGYANCGDVFTRNIGDYWLRGRIFKIDDDFVYVANFDLIYNIYNNWNVATGAAYNHTTPLLWNEVENANTTFFFLAACI